MVYGPNWGQQIYPIPELMLRLQDPDEDEDWFAEFRDAAAEDDRPGVGCPDHCDGAPDNCQCCYGPDGRADEIDVGLPMGAEL